MSILSSEEDISKEYTSDITQNTKSIYFEQKQKPKLLRVLTVVAYILSVSMAAIILSFYYIFMWPNGSKKVESNNTFLIPNTQDMELLSDTLTSQFDSNSTEMHRVQPMTEENGLFSELSTTEKLPSTWTPEYILNSEVKLRKSSTLMKKLIYRSIYENDIK